MNHPPTAQARTKLSHPRKLAAKNWWLAALDHGRGTSLFQNGQQVDLDDTLRGDGHSPDTTASRHRTSGRSVAPVIRSQGEPESEPASVVVSGSTTRLLPQPPLAMRPKSKVRRCTSSARAVRRQTTAEPSAPSTSHPMRAAAYAARARRQ